MFKEILLAAAIVACIVSIFLWGFMNGMNKSLNVMERDIDGAATTGHKLTIRGKTYRVERIYTENLVFSRDSILTGNFLIFNKSYLKFY